MASGAEQLASSFNFGAISKAAELKKRIWFTLGALIVYRLGTYIPILELILGFWKKYSSRTPAVSWECSICLLVVPWGG